MTYTRSLRQLRLLLTLAAVTALLGLGASRASAETIYGGLGHVGTGLIQSGTGGKHGQVAPHTAHGFAVDPKTGNLFIADEFIEGAHAFARIQEFAPKGEFLAENRVKLVEGVELGGIAVDAERNRVYMLVNELRPEANVKVEHEISKDEESLSKAEEAIGKKNEAIASKEAEIKRKEEKGESTVKLKEEVAKLKENVTELQAEVTQLPKAIAKLEEELQVFDPEAKAADAIYSFSTEVGSEKLKEQKLLTEALNSSSEEPKAALVDPSGIAVDPTTHDIVILGQQDESTHKGSGEEQLRAALQRVHASGVVGPRYIDRGDCLDEGAPTVEEKACAEKASVEMPGSPIVTSLGRVYVEEEGEVWEVPSPRSGEEAFKEVVSQPHRVFTLAAGQSLLNFGGSEELTNAMSFVSLGSGVGRIYLTATIAGEQNEYGVLALDYAEHSGTAEVTERGWTGGQGKTSHQEKCAIPIPTVAPLVAAGAGEQALVFDALPVSEGSAVDLFAFGPSGEAEACGHPAVAAPSVEVGEEHNATKVESGASATIASKLTGANAKSTKWKLTFKNKGAEEVEELTTGYQAGKTTLAHEFKHVGEYTINETVETDALGSQPITVKAAQSLTVTPSPPKLKIVLPHGSVRTGEPVMFEADVTDDNETTPHLKYTWNFGDGSAPVVEEEPATKSEVVHKTPHEFKSLCKAKCIITLEIEDSAKATKKEKVELTVEENVAQREQHEREQHEQEAREREAHEREQHEREARERSEGEAHERSEHEKHEREAHEAQERAHNEVLAFQASHNPEAKLAGTALTVTKSGVLVIKVSCPTSEETACLGAVTLKTLTAVKTSKKSKKAILALGSGTFDVGKGQTKTVTLHLSRRALSLLLHSHTLRVLGTVTAHDPAGVIRTTTGTVTLRLGKSGKR